MTINQQNKTDVIMAHVALINVIDKIKDNRKYDNDEGARMKRNKKAHTHTHPENRSTKIL